jgi:phenylacetate-CoA ligase
MTAREAFDWSQKKSYVAGVIWPPVARNPAAAIETLTRQLEETQWLTTAEIEAGQHAQLQALARHFARRLPPFIARLQNAGLTADTLNSREALRRLSLLGRRQLLKPIGVPDAQLPQNHLPVTVARTSGSTGEPVVVRKTTPNALMWRAMTMRELFWHERNFETRFTAIRATNPAYTLWDDWGGPVNLLFKTGPAQLIPITADIAQQWAWLQEFRPNVLLIYPNILDAIVKLSRRDNQTLPGLRLIRSVSETLSPQLRADAAETFGCRIVDNYSSQELGIIAVQCPDSDLYHVMDEALIVEVIGDDGKTCAPGEIGRVVITDLHNTATPMIRYDIGDYAQAGGPCPCGRGLHTLKRILGRERNLIRKPDGSRHWPLVGFAKFRDVAPVVQYQFVQDRLDHLEVRLVVERTMTAPEEDALRGVIQEALGFPFEISFSYFKGTIPRPANGKFEEFVCRI